MMEQLISDSNIPKHLGYCTKSGCVFITSLVSSSKVNWLAEEINEHVNEFGLDHKVLVGIALVDYVVLQSVVDDEVTQQADDQ